jgi:hypothetical protein
MQHTEGAQAVGSGIRAAIVHYHDFVFRRLAERIAVKRSKVVMMQPSSFRAGMTMDNFTSD